MGKKKLSYAAAMKDIATRKAKYEEQYAEAESRMDRFGMSGAKRSIERLDAAAESLFQEQESRKSKNSKVMALGGPTDPPVTGPAPAPSQYGSPQYNLQRARINAARDLLKTHGGVNNPNLSDKEVMQAAKLKGYWTEAGSNAKRAYAGKHSNYNFGNGGRIPKYNLGAQILKGASQVGKFALNNAPKAMDAIGKYAPYAAQFGTDIYALNQMKNIQAPVDAPMMDATVLNTNVDTSATEAALQNQSQLNLQNINRNVSSSAAATSAALASKVQTDQTFANVLQNKENQEMQLRNQQAHLLTQNRNQNMQISANNQQRLVDFNNMKTNARLELIQGMGLKAAQMGSEFAQRRADQESLNTLAAGFDQGIVNRNFGNLFDNPLNMEMSPEGNAMREQIKRAAEMDPNYKAMLQRTQPQLYKLIFG